MRGQKNSPSSVLGIPSDSRVSYCVDISACLPAVTSAQDNKPLLTAAAAVGGREGGVQCRRHPEGREGRQGGALGTINQGKGGRGCGGIGGGVGASAFASGVICWEGRKLAVLAGSSAGYSLYIHYLSNRVVNEIGDWMKTAGQKKLIFKYIFLLTSITRFVSGLGVEKGLASSFIVLSVTEKSL